MKENAGCVGAAIFLFLVFAVVGTCSVGAAFDERSPIRELSIGTAWISGGVVLASLLYLLLGAKK